MKENENNGGIGRKIDMGLRERCEGGGGGVEHVNERKKIEIWVNKNLTGKRNRYKEENKKYKDRRK